MYKEHFGLQRALFEGGIAREEGVFLGPRQQLVIANLKIALTTRDSIATLAGPVGVGKTTLASQALRMASTRLALAWIGGAPLSPDEVLELLLAEFDFTPYGMGKVERMHTWRQFITELNATDTRVCILVENAQAMGAEAIQALGPLTAADPNGCPGANLVIMGEPGLYEFFENPALAHLNQRIRSRQRVDPLTVAEVEAYLRCRTAAAGGNFEKIFAAGAGAALHCYTGGIPRVIDNVCETALALAAAGKQPQLTPADLMRVADRMYGLAPQGPIPATPKQAAAPAPEAAPSAEPEKPQAASPAPVAPQEPVQSAPAAEATEPESPITEPEPVSEATEPEPPVTEPEPVSEATEPEPPVAEPEPVSEATEPEPPITEPEPVSEATEPEPPVAEPEPAAEATEPEAPVESSFESSPAPSVEPPTLTEVVDDEPAGPSEDEDIADIERVEDEITEEEIEAAIAEAEKAQAEMAKAEAIDTTPSVPVVGEQPPEPQVDGEPALEVEAPEPPAAKEPVAPEPKAQLDERAAQTLAEAKSIEDISNSMAEALFGGDDDIDKLAAALDAAVPGAAARREVTNPGLSPEETSAVLQLADDAIAEPAEEAEPEAATAPPPAGTASRSA